MLLASIIDVKVGALKKCSMKALNYSSEFTPSPFQQNLRSTPIHPVLSFDT